MNNVSVTAENSVEAFITPWKGAEAAERANYQMFPHAPFVPVYLVTLKC